MDNRDVRSHRRAVQTATRAVLRAVAAVAIAIGLLLGAPADVAASCVKVTACQMYDHSSVVVQGMVTDMTDIDLGTEMIGGRPYQQVQTRVTIDVEKAWKGAAVGTTVQVYTDGKRTSVGFEFVHGRRYVVFASDRGGRLQTSLCSHTNPIDKAGEDLAFLETLARPTSGGRVYGRVTYEKRVFTIRERTAPEGLSGQRISLKGSSGTKEVLTTADGRYQFESLPAGAYELDADLPDGWGRRGLPRALTLPSLRSCEEIDISTAIDGRLSGRIVDTDGLPLARVQVEAAPLEVLRRAGTETTFPVSRTTDEQGRFELELLPPGRYVVGVNVIRGANNYAPYRFNAYPGISQTEPAAGITLDAAQHLDLGVLTVARVQARRVVHGRISWADGRPVMATRIIVTEIRPEWAGPEVRPGGPIRIDREGRFAVELHEGVGYRFVAEASLLPQLARRAAPEGPEAPPAGRTPVVVRGLQGTLPIIRSAAVDLTLSGVLPIVSLVLDEASAPPAR